MSKFQEMFEEPFQYEYPFGYVINGVDNSIEKAREIFFKEFTDNLVPEVHKYTKYYLNWQQNNIKEYYVDFHGYIDDTGEFTNGWVISPDYYTRPRAKRVWGVVPDYHFFRTGHEYTHQIDDYGHKKFSESWGRYNEIDCLVCSTIEELKELADKKWTEPAI